MFTGIVRAVGIIQSIERGRGGLQLTCKFPAGFKRAHEGYSVAVDGVCLTVTKYKNNTCTFDVVPETLERTTLGDLKRGDRVNIEPSLKQGDEIGGHFVLGHVDGVGVIKMRINKGMKALMTINVPKKLMNNIAKKGSVAVDGVSLTVAEVQENILMVALIPHTMKYTTLGKLNKGDKVNIEVDVLARYHSHCHLAPRTSRSETKFLLRGKQYSKIQKNKLDL